MTSMLTKFTLSSEPGWGVAFRIGERVQVYQQSLFWLLCKGIRYHSCDLKLDYFLGTEIISSEFSLEVVTRLLDSINIIYFVEDDGIRWLLPHNVSTLFYSQWKNYIVSEFEMSGLVIN